MWKSSSGSGRQQNRLPNKRVGARAGAAQPAQPVLGIPWHCNDAPAIKQT